MQTSQRIVPVWAGVSGGLNLGRGEWGRRPPCGESSFQACPYNSSFISDTSQWLEKSVGTFLNIHVLYLPSYKIFTSLQICQWTCSGFCPEVIEAAWWKSNGKRWLCFCLCDLAFANPLIYLFKMQLMTSLPEAISSRSDPSLFASQSQHRLHELWQ